MKNLLSVLEILKTFFFFVVLATLCMKRLHLSPILAERKDLLFLQFSDKLSRECFLSDIRSVSSFQVRSPDGKQPIADENPFNILVLPDMTVPDGYRHRLYIRFFDQ
jgi:hypothetical protein